MTRFVTKIPQQPYNRKGFTLIELLVAVTVFAVLSVMAYGGLRSVINNSAHSSAALERIHEVQRAMHVIARDLSQIVKRDIRDELGVRHPALSASNIQDSLVEFTRNGRRNPAELSRSTLLRVTYKHEETTLTRLFWPQLDRVQGMTPYETTLIEGVKNIELRYLDDQNNWQSQWPPDSTQQANSISPDSLPIAIEVKLELEDWGEITRVVRVNF